MYSLLCILCIVYCVCYVLLCSSNALRCACWSDQGDRLYVATKSTVWIFSWANIDHKIKEFSSEETLLMGY